MPGATAVESPDEAHHQGGGSTLQSPINATTHYTKVAIVLHWLIANHPPPLPSFIPSWERRAATWSHFALYVCMLGMPLSGYIASNFSKYDVKLFNRILLSPWGTEDARVYAIFNISKRPEAHWTRLPAQLSSCWRKKTLPA